MSLSTKAMMKVNFHPRTRRYSSNNPSSSVSDCLWRQLQLVGGEDAKHLFQNDKVGMQKVTNPNSTSKYLYIEEIQFPKLRFFTLNKIDVSSIENFCRKWMPNLEVFGISKFSIM